MQKKERLPLRKTATGVSEWPTLIDPDYAFDSKGIYKAELILDLKDCQEDKDYIDNLIKKQKDEWVKLHGVNKKIPEENVPYEVLGEGKVKFKFKLYASNQKRDGSTFTQRPDVRDNENQPWDKSKAIWSGTTMKIAYEPVPYANSGIGLGVSLRLKGAQIIDLKQGGGVEWTPTEGNSGGSSLPTDQEVC